MPKVSILEMLEGVWQDGTRPKDLFALHVATAPSEFKDDIVAGLGSQNRRVQGGCAELASLLSETCPELLYPHIELFLTNLDSGAPILRWEAVCTIGNLASVDEKRRIAPHVDRIASLLGHDSIVLQGHAVRALAKVAQRHRDLAPRILQALLAARGSFPESRIGYIVEAMAAFAFDPKLAGDARRFVELYAGCGIKPVEGKARRALRALSASAPAAGKPKAKTAKKPKKV